MLPQRRVLSVEDFTHDQIRAYLANRFDDGDEAAARMSLMEGIKDLLGLAQNPRMLELHRRPRRRPAAYGGPAPAHTISPALLYRGDPRLLAGLRGAAGQGAGVADAR